GAGREPPAEAAHGNAENDEEARRRQDGAHAGGHGRQDARGTASVLTPGAERRVTGLGAASGRLSGPLSRPFQAPPKLRGVDPYGRLLQAFDLRRIPRSFR